MQVPTDFSIHSRRVLECVACCPQIEEAVLAHMVTADWRSAPMSTIDKLEARMDEGKRFLQETRNAGPLEGQVQDGGWDVQQCGPRLENGIG